MRDRISIRLDAIGGEAKLRVDGGDRSAADAPPRADPDDYARVMALNDYLFEELRFVGNDVTYEDPRNSFLNEVLDRRTGIPITLALVYIEVARRAGLHVEGVNFPGHFLVRCPARRGLAQTDDLIIDAFHGGACCRRTPAASGSAATPATRRCRIAAARSRHEAADPRAHAAEPEAPVRAACIRFRRRSTSRNCCWPSTPLPSTSCGIADCWPIT